MKCVNPFTRSGMAYGCGQCLPCRVQQRRIWKTRIMLEAMEHPKNNVFATLTYSDEALPFTCVGKSQQPTLDPRHLQLFLKRLRHHCPQQLRFFAVGEYGNKSWRPHYHAGLFNFFQCARGETKKSHTGRCLWAECCAQCRMVGEVWGKGDIELRDLDASKCEYLARYVTKKMTKGEDARLVGRHPEFSRQSRRPGIGRYAVRQLARSIADCVDPAELVDVPGSIKIGGKQLALGRYMRRKLRGALGLPEGASDEVLREAWIEQVLPVLQVAKEDQEEPGLRAAFRKANAGYEARLKFRQDNFEQGKF